MKTTNVLGELACREHLLAGNRLTGLEASVMFGVGLLSRLVSRMRKEGYVVKSKTCTYAAVIQRLAPFAQLTPPIGLPVREIHFTEYWISK